MTCHDFRPDHNGECLNCDEWADAHDDPPLSELGLARVVPEFEEHIVHQMSRVLSGELSLEQSAAMIGLAPNALSLLYDYLRPR
jgi:hypothetical protein